MSVETVCFVGWLANHSSFKPKTEISMADDDNNNSDGSTTAADGASTTSRSGPCSVPPRRPTCPLAAAAFAGSSSSIFSSSCFPCLLILLRRKWRHLFEVGDRDIMMGLLPAERWTHSAPRTYYTEPQKQLHRCWLSYKRVRSAVCEVLSCGRHKRAVESQWVCHLSQWGSCLFGESISLLHFVNSLAHYRKSAHIYKDKNSICAS